MLHSAPNEVCLDLVDLVDQHVEHVVAIDIILAAGLSKEKKILILRKGLGFRNEDLPGRYFRVGLWIRRSIEL